MAVGGLHIPHRLQTRLVPRPAAHPESWATQLRWFAAAALVSFAVPFLGSSVLGLQHDVYLAIYFVAVLSVLTAYAVATGLDVRATLRRQWKLGVVLGVVVGVLLVRKVLSQDATPRPHGAYYVFELIWRGGIYGAVDALLLTVLPCLVVYRSLGGHLATWGRRIAYFCSLARARRDHHRGLPPGLRAVSPRRHWRTGDGQHAHLDPDAPEHEPDRLDRRPHGDAHLGCHAHLRDHRAAAPADEGALGPAMSSATPSRRIAPRAKPLLGVRRQPGRLALAVFRLPLPLYRRGWGWLLGHTFLLLVHAGRKTGKLHATVAMALRYDPETHEAVICSVWGQNTDWVRNIRVRPAMQIQIGRESFTPEQRFLSEGESFAVVVEFRRRHPWRLRLLTWILGWGDLRSDTAVRDSSAVGRSCHSVRRTPPGPKTAPASSCCDSGRLWAGRP